MSDRSAPVLQRLLVFNLAMDLDHSMLAFASRWVDALAAQVKSVDVVTMTRGRLRVPTNVQVHSVGKERGFSEVRRLFEFYRILGRVLATTPVDACFSHMMPLFSVLGAPMLWARRVPLVTWYAHPALTPMLKFAHHLSDRMVTSLPTSYPYRGDKLSVIGQGTDTELFAPDGTTPDDPPMILCVGRMAPVKDHVTLLEAVVKLRETRREPFSVVLLGEAVGEDGRRYRDSLQARAKALRVDDVIRFEPHVESSQLPDWYRRSTLQVNLSQTGFGDKVVWESLSCERPCVAANAGFSDLLGSYAQRLLFARGDAEGLAQRIGFLLDLSECERQEIGRYFRKRVVESHSLPGLASRVIGVLQECMRSQGRNR